jgi:hypothetical protein
MTGRMDVFFVKMMTKRGKDFRDWWLRIKSFGYDQVKFEKTKVYIRDKYNTYVNTKVEWYA